MNVLGCQDKLQNNMELSLRIIVGASTYGAFMKAPGSNFVVLRQVACALPVQELCQIGNDEVQKIRLTMRHVIYDYETK